ncbi:MAG: calcium-binding protein [Planctomycetota bacterium]|nr:calcium-binding protein [Planctomycetota bacterium]MDA1251972.1 calcium-binding protein [Planctomycetota bacterium]
MLRNFWLNGLLQTDLIEDCRVVARRRKLRRSIHNQRRTRAGRTGVPSGSIELEIQTLETRILPAVIVQFDYSLDSNGFFDDSARRTVFEDAVGEVAGRLDDRLLEIVPNKISAGDTWTATYTDPSTGSDTSTTDLIIGENVIVVFAGARQLGSTLGVGGPGGFTASGETQEWLDTVAGRGQDGALTGSGNETDFSLWGGSLAFDIDANWHFGDSIIGLDPDENDFYSVAQHEFAHLIGFGTAASWDNLVSSGEFTGSTAAAEHDFSGNPPLDSDNEHWQDGLIDDSNETALDPTLSDGTRKTLTALDYAALADIGWNVSSDGGMGGNEGGDGGGGDGGGGNETSIQLIDGSPHTVVLSDNGIAGDGISQYVLDGGSPVTIITGSDAFEVTGGDMADQITIDSLDSAFTGPLTIHGGAGDDTISVNHDAHDAITVNGDGGSNTIEVTGSDAQTVIHNFSDSADGTVVLNDGSSAATITYTGINQLDDGVTSTDRGFIFGPTGDTVTLGDDSQTGNGKLQISSVSSGSTIDFALPTGTITVSTGDGNDTVTVALLEAAFGGSVIVNAEAGNDTIDASATGHGVTIDGGTGDDRITGSDQNDNLVGGDGRDLVIAGGGNDILTGGADADTLQGDDGDDVINGGDGDGDRLRGGAGSNTLNGGDGNDLVDELGDTDFTLTAGSLVGPGTNTLIDIEGAVLIGGDSANTFDATASTIPVSIYGSGGNDTILGSAYDDILFGMSGDDLIEGNDGNDSLFGSTGADTLIGGNGNDSLFGQGGSGDQLTGGAGDDVLSGGSGTDSAVESGDVDFTVTNFQLIGIGTDRLIGVEQAILTTGDSANLIDSTSYTGLIIVVTGDGDDTVRSGSGSDHITTGNGNDVVESGLGSDFIQTGAGDYVISGGGGNDTINAGAGDDSIHGGDGDDEILAGDGADEVHGDAGNDTARGEAGNDTLFGGLGNDSLLGGDGDDVLNGDDGDDTLNGGAGDDTLDGGNGNDGLSGFTGNDQLIGNFGDDTLFGGEGIDGLIGAAGNDLLIGGGDDDFVKGNGGFDTLLGGSGAGADPGDTVESNAPDEIDEFFGFVKPDWVDTV